MSHKNVSGTLASAVADAGTFTVSYPANTDEGTFRFGVEHRLVMGQQTLQSTEDFTLTFGASNITVTNATGSTWAAGTDWRLQIEKPGKGGDIKDPSTKETLERVANAPVQLISLGAPDAKDPNGVCESQSGAAGALTLNGALVSGGVATFDVPRNVTIDSGGADTATLTITGTDEYGNTVVENITLNGSTEVAGKKAFKTVTSVVSDATINNGAFVGTGDVLGLPVFLPATGLVVAEIDDGAAASAGTVVAGVETEATATTGDVRGTYTPNSATDGDMYLHLLVALPDPTYLGVPQYAG